MCPRSGARQLQSLSVFPSRLKPICSPVISQSAPQNTSTPSVAQEPSSGPLPSNVTPSRDRCQQPGEEGGQTERQHDQHQRVQQQHEQQREPQQQRAHRRRHLCGRPLSRWRQSWRRAGPWRSCRCTPAGCWGPGVARASAAGRQGSSRRNAQRRTSGPIFAGVLMVVVAGRHSFGSVPQAVLATAKHVVSCTGHSTQPRSVTVPSRLREHSALGHAAGRPTNAGAWLSNGAGVVASSIGCQPERARCTARKTASSCSASCIVLLARQRLQSLAIEAPLLPPAILLCTIALSQSRREGWRPIGSRLAQCNKCCFRLTLASQHDRNTLVRQHDLGCVALVISLDLTMAVQSMGGIDSSDGGADAPAPGPVPSRCSTQTARSCCLRRLWQP